MRVVPAGLGELPAFVLTVAPHHGVVAHVHPAVAAFGEGHPEVPVLVPVEPVPLAPAPERADHLGPEQCRGGVLVDEGDAVGVQPGRHAPQLGPATELQVVTEGSGGTIRGVEPISELGQRSLHGHIVRVEGEQEACLRCRQSGVAGGRGSAVPVVPEDRDARRLESLQDGGRGGVVRCVVHHDHGDRLALPHRVDRLLDEPPVVEAGHGHGDPRLAQRPLPSARRHTIGGCGGCFW